MLEKFLDKFLNDHQVLVLMENVHYIQDRYDEYEFHRDAIDNL